VARTWALQATCLGGRKPYHFFCTSVHYLYHAPVLRAIPVLALTVSSKDDSFQWEEYKINHHCRAQMPVWGEYISMGGSKARCLQNRRKKLGGNPPKVAPVGYGEGILSSFFAVLEIEARASCCMVESTLPLSPRGRNSDAFNPPLCSPFWHPTLFLYSTRVLNK
jgi:hypothetical protein